MGLLAWFVHHSFVRAPFWRELNWSLELLLGLLLITVLYSVVHVYSAGVSWVLLRSLGEEPASFAQVAASVLLPQIAKYVPGNVAHHIGRVILSRSLGFRMHRVLFAMFVETFWVIAIGIAMAIAFGIEHFVHLLPGLLQDSADVVLLLAVVGALMAPYLLYRPFRQLSSRFLSKQGIEPAKDLYFPPLQVGLLCVFAYFLNYSILGLILGALGMVLFDQTFFNLLYLGGVFAIAWIVGFVTPGSPAGLGVREVILLSLLSPIYGMEAATGIAGVLRLVTVAGDALTWIYGTLAWRIASQTGS